MRNIILAIVVGSVIGLLSGCRGNSEQKRVTAAYQDYRQAMASSDMARIKDRVSNRFIHEFLSPGQEMKLEMLKAVWPVEVEIERVSINEKEAVVKSRGVKNGMTAKGTTSLVREGSGWKIVNESWNFEGSSQESSDTIPDGGASSADDSSNGLVSKMSESGDTNVSGRKSVAELMAELKDPNLYGKDSILDSLLQQGAREEAVRALNEILREKPDFDGDIKRLIKRAGAPVTFNWRRNSFEPKETDFSWREFDVEFKNGGVVSSGRAYLGRDVVEGFSREQNTETPMPLFARYNFRVKGTGLVDPIEKVVDVEARVGEHSWNEMQIASGLGKGEYEVSLLLHAQTVKPDGVPISINAGPVILTLNGE